jgi:cell fate regulator YaaT (PSP1 superfamily)
MSNLAGVRFFQAGKIYYFHAADIELEINDHVVVETNRGIELGQVVILQDRKSNDTSTEPLKPVIRKATEEDFKQDERRQEKNIRALAKSKELIAKLNLPMKPISAQYNLDESHLTVFFIAEKRVDFRELVKELSRNLKTHVELRQIGARDEAKYVGGLGKCGLPLCCITILTEFNPVSIRMAKEQNITLNPIKTSGLCGRLLCCLGYEYEQYKNLKEALPPIGQEVNTSLGRAKIVAQNPVKEAVMVQLESGAVVELPHAEIKSVRTTGRRE